MTDEVKPESAPVFGEQLPRTSAVYCPQCDREYEQERRKFCCECGWQLNGKRRDEYLNERRFPGKG